MAQIQSGETFTNGEQVDAARLNNQFASGILLAGAITEQTPVSALDIELTDYILIYDASANALRKASVTDLFGNAAGLPIKKVESVTQLVINQGSGNGVKIYGTVDLMDAVNANGGTFSAGGTGTEDITLAGKVVAISGATSLTISGTKTISGTTNVTGTLDASGTTSVLVPTPTLAGQAATKGYADGTLSASASGYLELGNGFIMNWGTTGNIASVAYKTTTFAKAYTTTNFGVFITPITAGSTAQAHDWVSNRGLTSFEMQNATPVTANFAYFSIGK